MCASGNWRIQPHHPRIALWEVVTPTLPAPDPLSARRGHVTEAMSVGCTFGSAPPRRGAPSFPVTVSSQWAARWTLPDASRGDSLAGMERIDLPDASAEPIVYRDALLALRGDRDALEVMAQTLETLPRLLGGLDDGAWRHRPEPGEWSPYELMGHFFDVDLVFGFRWRLTATADGAAYPGYDENAFAALSRPEPARLLDIWAGLREANLAFLRALPDAAYQHVGVHGEQGEELLRVAVDKFAGHDIAHLDQFRRTLPPR